MLMLLKYKLTDDTNGQKYIMKREQQTLVNYVCILIYETKTDTSFPLL